VAAMAAQDRGDVLNWIFNHLFHTEGRVVIMTPFVIITFNTITYSHFPSYVYKPHFIFNLDKILKTFYSFIYFPCVFLFISLFCIRSIGSI